MSVRPFSQRSLSHGRQLNLCEAVRLGPGKTKFDVDDAKSLTLFVGAGKGNIVCVHALRAIYKYESMC